MRRACSPSSSRSSSRRCSGAGCQRRARRPDRCRCDRSTEARSRASWIRGMRPASCVSKQHCLRAWPAPATAAREKMPVLARVPGHREQHGVRGHVRDRGGQGQGRVLGDGLSEPVLRGGDVADEIPTPSRPRPRHGARRRLRCSHPDCSPGSDLWFKANLALLANQPNVALAICPKVGAGYTPPNPFGPEAIDPSDAGIPPTLARRAWRRPATPRCWLASPAARCARSPVRPAPP